jgi:hypothetical protein
MTLKREIRYKAISIYVGALTRRQETATAGKHITHLPAKENKLQRVQEKFCNELRK